MANLICSNLHGRIYVIKNLNKNVKYVESRIKKEISYPKNNWEFSDKWAASANKKKREIVLSHVYYYINSLLSTLSIRTDT